jgi:hypothetical protein
MKTEDGWIEHDGKGIPVSPETLVLVRFRDGSPHYDKLGTQRPASKWHSNIRALSNWIHDGHGGDIVAYRVLDAEPDFTTTNHFIADVGGEI